MTALEAFELNLGMWERQPGKDETRIVIRKDEGLKLLKEIRELRGAKESMSYIGNYPGPNQWKCFKCGYVTP